MNSVRDTSDTQSVAGSVATTAVPQVKKYKKLKSLHIDFSHLNAFVIFICPGVIYGHSPNAELT
jgi:hypothetical protein